MSATTVCENQDTFNNAVSIAIDNYKEEKKTSAQVSTGTMTIYAILMLILFIWAIVLAFQVKKGSERILHLLAAMILSPLYIISYYVNML